MDIQQIPSDAKAVTPSDTVDNPGCGFVVGASGNVSVITKQGTTVTIPAVAGVPIALQFTRIRSTNTTATGIVRFAL